MKMKDLFCTLSLFLGLLALPLPGRAQHPDSLLREAAARDQQVRMQLLEMNRRVNGGEYSAALVDSLVAAGAEMERIDRENMRLVASLLRDGLPEGLAAESYDAVWLIIDHASLKEQKKFLPLLREAAGRGVISAYKLATLEDRVAMYEERPQRYGTQSYQTERRRRDRYLCLARRASGAARFAARGDRHLPDGGVCPAAGGDLGRAGRLRSGAYGRQPEADCRKEGPFLSRPAAVPSRLLECKTWPTARTGQSWLLPVAHADDARRTPVSACR